MNQFVAITTAAVLAVTTLATSIQPAEAGRRDAAAAAALGLLGGIIVGGAIANARPAPRYVAPGYVPVNAGDAHVAWCARKYRSYNVYDNTWIDKHGRVRLCASPYGY